MKEPEFIGYEHILNNYIEKIQSDNDFITSLNVTDLKRLISFIQFERDTEERMIDLFSKKPTKLFHGTSDAIKKKFRKIEQSKFELFDEIEAIAVKQYDHLTRHLDIKKEISYRLKDWMKEPKHYEKLSQIIDELFKKHKYWNHPYKCALLHNLDTKGYLNGAKNSEIRCKIAANYFNDEKCLRRESHQSRDKELYSFPEIPHSNRIAE